MDELSKLLKEFSENLEKRFSALEKRIEATATESANLRERVFDLERGTPGFKDPSDFNRPDEVDEQ
jgi:chaperonin cofactor prefoldin